MLLKLTIEERINLFQGLPARGGKKETQRNFSSFKNKIELTKKEEETIGLRVLNDGRMTWQDTAKQAVGFELSEAEVEALKVFFDNLEEQEQFPAWGVDVDDQLEAHIEKTQLKKA